MFMWIFIAMVVCLVGAFVERYFSKWALMSVFLITTVHAYSNDSDIAYMVAIIAFCAFVMLRAYDLGKSLRV